MSPKEKENCLANRNPICLEMAKLGDKRHCSISKSTLLYISIDTAEDAIHFKLFHIYHSTLLNVLIDTALHLNRHCSASQSTLLTSSVGTSCSSCNRHYSQFQQTLLFISMDTALNLKEHKYQEALVFV